LPLPTRLGNKISENWHGPDHVHVTFVKFCTSSIISRNPYKCISKRYRITKQFILLETDVDQNHSDKLTTDVIQKIDLVFHTAKITQLHTLLPTSAVIKQQI